ncbi:hypothetical protein MBANPS3_009127 [Mucor bainieri]
MSMSSNHFLTTDHLDLSSYSEHDLQHKIWPVMYQLYSDLKIVAKLAEKSSEATSQRKNRERCLESEKARINKVVSAKLDTLYKYGDVELGCAEFGRGRISTIEEKFINHGMIKLPTILRDMLSTMTGVNDDHAGDLLAVGFVVMGADMQLVTMMETPHSRNIARISRSPVVKFPFQIAEFADDMLNVLHLVWAGKQLMLRCIEAQASRKRKGQPIKFANQKKRLVVRPSLDL